MIDSKNIEVIGVDELVDKAAAKHKAGYRLVQLSATRLPDQVEVTYSFDRDSRLSHLRIALAAEGSRVPSISSVYGCAVLYENELHDLFEVKVDGMQVDFQGGLYRTAVKFPFGSTKVPCAAPAATGPASCVPPAQPGAQPATPQT